MDEALATEAAEAASAKTQLTKQHRRDTARIGSPKKYLDYRMALQMQILATKNSVPETFRSVLNPYLKGGRLSWSTVGIVKRKKGSPKKA